MTEYVTPNIHTVLKKYQNTAPKSLQGPGHALVAAAAAAAAAGCPGGINCPLDASINSGDLASSSIANRALSPCIAANLSTTSSNSLCGNKQSNPAVALIKKEILTSPEPLPLSSQSTCSSSSSSSSSTTGSSSSSVANAYVDMSQAQQHVAVSPPTIKIVPPPPPELSQPILSAADSCSGELYETRLEGKTIGCFSLGGEMRLCLPQFLNNVLGDFTLDQINRIFDELGIFCSQCTPDQLLEFKAAKILPSDVKASGLITRTDAERLCAALLHRSDRTNYISVDIPKNAISFKVYHRCFGKCEGICTPDMYSYANPTCIMCLECKGWFSPQKFVGHVHRKVENRTCHWGFDSRNWHDYLHVALDVENREKYQKILDQLKEVEIKETVRQQQQREINFMKRKVDIPLDDVLVGTSIPGSMLPGVVMQAPPHQLLPPGGKQRIAGAEILDIPSTTNKKGKNLDEASAYQLEYQRYQTLMYAHCAQQQQQQQQHQQQQHQRMGSISAFRPWAPPKSFLQAAAAASYNAACVVGAFSTLPYLSQEPPVLQNPERVVRNADRERFERTYQPNVALAPRKNILNKEREKEQRERERERIDRERERELDRVRERERERERERQRERERDRQQKQQQQQQQQQIFQQRMTETICAGGCTNLCEAEVHIKQERASTPQSPLHLTNAGNDATTDDDTAMDRRSASMLHEEATMPMISPMALSMNHQQQQQQLKSSDMTSSASHRRHSIHTSNTTPSSSGCSASSSITPPEQQLLPAHLPRHLKHLTIAQQQQQQQKQQNILRQSPSPSPTTNNNKNNNNNRNNLEEFGSSNEITSSTSPVPQASNHQVRHHHLHQQHQASTSASTTSQQQVAIQQQQQQPQPAHVQSIIATVNQHTKLLPSSSANVPTPITNSNSNTNSSSNNNEISSRIRINKNLMRSPTTPPPQQQHHQHQQHHVHENQLPQKQYEYLKEKENHQQRLYTQHQHQQQNQQQRQQQQHYIRHQHQHHSPTQSSSSSGGLNLSTNNTAKSHQQQQQHHQLHNGLHMGSEFELSTDTDDDSSLNGEPDSSNILAPWEMAVEALRDTRPKDRERVLQLLQRLLQENQQYRYNNVQLSEILQKRDAHISELREQIENYRRQLEQLEKKQQQQQQQRSKEQEQQNVNASVVGGDGGGVIATKSDASEELRVPLKKSLRRDPDRTEKSEEERIVERQSVEDSVVENDGNSNESSSENGASSMVSKNTKDEESDADGGGDLANEEFQIKVEKAPALEKPLHQMNGNGNDDETPRLPNGHHDESSRFSGSDIGSEQDDDTKDEKVVVKNEVENENRKNENDDIVAHDSDDDDEMMNYNEEDNDDDVVDDDDDDDDDGDDEELQRNCNEKAVMVQAPHTNAAVTPPTATTPISPDSAATAGQLFDSSNSSDDSSMKKAQMSASNALAKMTAEVESAQEERDHRNDNAAERDDDNDDDGDEDEDTRSEDSMNESDDLNAKRRRVMKRDHDCIGNADSDDNDARDELLFAKKRHQEQEQKEEGIPNIDSTTTTTTKLLATTVVPTSPTTTASTVVVPPLPPPSMIFKPIVTKASRKQTPASPTTNCDLQIKKEIF